MVRTIAIKLEKIFFYVILFMVSLLVVFAFYVNRDKFIGTETTKYVKISIEHAVSVDELVKEYSDSGSREKFVAEVKRMNNIENPGFISSKTIIVPIFKSN